MPEYIERDVVIDDIGDLFTICYETLPNEYGHHFIVEKELQTHLDFVRNLPAADVVEVVRCLDCKYINLADNTVEGKADVTETSYGNLFNIDLIKVKMIIVLTANARRTRNE